MPSADETEARQRADRPAQHKRAEEDAQQDQEGPLTFYHDGQAMDV